MIITILMPALNEEESIGKTIKMIPVDKLKEMGYLPEILIVDGGSMDNTVESARSLGAKVISSRKGYGRQYRTGFENSSGEIIVTADSDCSYPMEEIPALLNILQTENLDFISTNRFAFMDHDSMMPVNRFGNRVLTLISNLLFSFRLKDSQSGMWIIRKKMLGEICLTGNGMSLSQEIKIKAFRKFKAKEVDSTYRKRVGKVKLRIFIDGFDNLFNLIKLKFRG
jgi:glycosyltransferase involved in cell wall biosynthesis